MKKNYSIPRAETRCTKAISLKHLSNKAIIHSAILLFCTIGILGTSPALAQQSKIDSLLKVIQETNIDTVKIEALCSIANQYINVEPEKSVGYARQGIDLSKKSKFKKGHSDCLRALGVANYFIGKYDSSLINFGERLVIVESINDSIGIASCFGNMGNIKYRQSSYGEATHFFEKANVIFKACKKYDLLASGYLSIGNVFLAQSEFTKTIEYFLKADQLYEEQHNLEGGSISSINLSGTYLSIKQYDEAIKYAKSAIKKAIDSNNPLRHQSALIALAKAYFEKNDYHNSLLILDEAKTLSDKTKIKYDQAHIMQLYVLIYTKTKVLDKAVACNSELSQLARELNDKILIIASIQNASTFYSDKKDYRNALKSLKKAEQILKEINYKDAQLDILKGFVFNYAHINSDSVSMYFNRYSELKDSIYSQQTSKAIAEMQTKYETEKKDKEILSLNLEAQKRKNTVWLITSGFGFLLVLSGSGFGLYRNRKKKEQTELQHQITEHDIKALRAQMNPHFIFNCIHSIDCLLDDGKIQKSKENLANFSSLTRSVLENSERREIPLREELRILSLYLDLENSRFDIPFTYLFEIDPVIDPDETLVPPIILQPFAENAIKHGFDKAKGGHIKITINCENDQLVCTIEDNGCGRKIGQKTVQVSGIKKGSMGLKLTEDRLKLVSQQKQAKAGFAIEDLLGDNNSPAGTRIRLELPMG